MYKTWPMKKLFILLFLTFLSVVATSCGQSVKTNDCAENYICELISEGEYKEAADFIRLEIATSDLSPQEIWKHNFTIERLERIEKDFNKTEEQILEQIKEFYPNVTPEEIAKWEQSNVLENKIINGEKKYFRNAARNVFRIDKNAGDEFVKINGRQSNTLDTFLEGYLPSVVKSTKESKREKPIHFKIKYTLSVDADAVPAGEVLRVWMPMVRKDPKNSNIKLISTSQANYIISPDNYSHKSIYMEKKAVAGKKTEFEYIFSYDSRNKWFDIEAKDIKPYNTNSKIYKKYTSERETHVIFSDRIKHLTDSIIGNETNPLLKAKSIYTWINNNFPWASAREYSTIENIPEYVLDNHHGDCGQVSLLFITMARYAGIPAKWQSGWMLHPGAVNLHDWAEVYYEGFGWIPVDQSFGITKSDNEDVQYYFLTGLDAYRVIVNDDFSMPFYPAKIYPRSETVDFQRGEVEWRGGNLYFDLWDYDLEIL